MIVHPSAAKTEQQTSVLPGRFSFLSKIPLVHLIRKYYFHLIFVYYSFFRKSQKPNKPQVCRLKIYEMYRFADKFDVLLMTIGTIAG